MRHVRCVLISILLLSVLGGCSKKYTEVAVEAPTTEERTSRSIVVEDETNSSEPSVEEPDERVEVDGKIKSYLTGEMVDVAKANRRPLAIMMSNDKAALPQYGINRAGIVYEAPVEGAMNRYMAIIEDYDDLDRIGSVRSCRTYYTYFAKEFEAIYAHFGQSTFAKPYLNNLDHINGIEGKGVSAFYRSKDRKQPHNAYASFGGIQKAIEAMDISQEYPADYKGHYQFAKSSEPVLLKTGREASHVEPGYQMNQPWFEYNEEDGLYYRYQYGGKHLGDEGQIAVKNIIFQYCEYGHYATTEYLNINVHSSEKGYYFTNGKCVSVTWKKDGEFGVTHYYDEDGQEIKLNPGKTWVCIIPTDRYDKAEFYGE